MTRLLCLVTLVLAAGIALAWWRSRGRGTGRRATAAQLRRRIVRMTADRAVAERLVRAEGARHPELSERALLAKVLRRLQRDRGR